MDGNRSRGSATRRAIALALALSLPPSHAEAGVLPTAEPLAGFAAPGAGLPLFDTLGDHTRRISTSSQAAQRHFDQGLRFLYAFDQEAAYRSFARAMESDPGCAIAADRAYREVMEEGPIFLFYSAHNYHFLAFAAAMEGRYDLALEAARALVREIPMETFRHMKEMDGMVAMPYLVHVRFGQWEALLGEPPPPGDMAYPTALWHMGRGLAFAHTGSPDQAEEELGALERALRATPAGERKGLGTTANLLGIASNVLAAAVAEERGEIDEAVHLLRQAVEAEDGLT